MLFLALAGVQATVSGLISISPSMAILSSTPGVQITVSFAKRAVLYVLLRISVSSKAQEWISLISTEYMISGLLLEKKPAGMSRCHCSGRTKGLGKRIPWMTKMTMGKMAMGKLPKRQSMHRPYATFQIRLIYYIETGILMVFYKCIHSLSSRCIHCSPRCNAVLINGTNGVWWGE